MPLDSWGGSCYLYLASKIEVSGERENCYSLCGEEEYMVSHLNSFKYVDMDGELIETLFQNFEVIPQKIGVSKSTSIAPKITKDPPRMASLKEARAVVEDGGCTI